MLIFVFVSAILNLSIGYALGSGFKLPAGLSTIPLLRKKKKLDDLDDEEALTRPVEVKSDAKPTTALPPTVTIAAPQPDVVPTETEPTPELKSVEPAKEVTKKELTTADLMAGLSNLQLQLSEVSQELKSHEDNPDEFGQCASRMQEVNHDYLEKAHGTIEQLDELENAGDATAKAAKEVATVGCEKAEQASQKMDAILEGELDEAACKELLAQSAAMVASAHESCQLGAPVPATATSAESQNQTVTKECSIEELFEKIEDAIHQIKEGESLFLAEARLDPPKVPISEASLLDGITNDLNALIADSITADQSYSVTGRRLMLLQGDTLEHACQRVEQVRQGFESTTYMANSATAQATVTCAVSEVSHGASRGEIERQLINALEEADQIGVNRTFHHDGAFATAISPLDLPIEKRVVEI